MLKNACRVLFCIAIFSCPPLFAADHGLFMVVKGSVKVIAGADKKETVAKVGSKVFSGDTVITEKDSRAKIVMSDRNVLQLSPDSKFEITKYKTGATENDRQVQVALMEGKVRVEVEQKYGEKNKFELRTPTAVAGVRGTKYVAQYSPITASTTIIVINGSVAVNSVKSPGAPVLLSPGMASNVGANGPPGAPYKAPKSELNSDGASSGGAKNSMVTSEDVGAKATDPGKVADGGPTSSSPAGAPPLPPQLPAVVAQPPPPPPPPRPPILGTKTKVIVTPTPK